MATSAAGAPSAPRRPGNPRLRESGFASPKADALQPVAAERREALERQREMGAALIRRDRMDLVDDRQAGGRQHLPPGFRAEQHVERFRRRHQDVRRPAAHPLALGRRACRQSGPRCGSRRRGARSAELLADAGERRLEIAVDVVRQRLQRRHVDDLRLIGEPALEPLPHQFVDRRQKRRQRLARPGRRGDQRMPAGLDRRPRLGLRRRRRGESLGEPPGDGGMEQRSYGCWRSRRGLKPARGRSRGCGRSEVGVQAARFPKGRAGMASGLLYRAPPRALAPPPRSLAERGDLGKAGGLRQTRESRNDQYDPTMSPSMTALRCLSLGSGLSDAPRRDREDDRARRRRRLSPGRHRIDVWERGRRRPSLAQPGDVFVTTKSAIRITATTKRCAPSTSAPESSRRERLIST